jgi:HAD superfamily hydrolase (TIGR01509 family)
MPNRSPFFLIKIFLNITNIAYHSGVKKYFHVDLDGTLVDTFAANCLSYKESIEAIGFRWVPKIQAEIEKGEKSEVFLKKLLNLSSSETKAVIEYKNSIYPSFFHLIKVNPKLLDFLKKNESRFSIVTNANRDNTERILKFFDLHKEIDFIVASEDVLSTKPSPEPYLLSVNLVSLKYSHVMEHVAIEDSHLGEISARRAGIQVIRM